METISKVKYLILGGGPSGLAFANRLLDNGEKNFFVLEKEKYAGGLCRSEYADGSPIDIGGGHFLDVKRKPVLEFLWRFMPENEWNKFVRNSKIALPFGWINSPIEANIYQMPVDMQVTYLKDIFNAGCNQGKRKPEMFVDWIYWKLGRKISLDYMIPYNQKMFGNDLNSLGTYWLDKLPDVSFEDTLVSCLTRKPTGKQPAHAEFYYPKKYGYGELWLRMADNIKDKILYGYKVKSIDYETLTVDKRFQADIIVNTVPYTDIELEGIPKKLRNLIFELKSTSIVVSYIGQTLKTDAHWVYCPDPAVEYHRILVRHNFCKDSKGYWTETNLSRFNEKDFEDKINYINDYAYPLNTVNKNEIIGKLLAFGESKNVYGLGRWGEWQHYNSDVVVERALHLADKLTLK